MLSIKKKELIIHISFWISYFLLRIFFVRIYQIDIFNTIYLEIIELPLKVTTVYVVIYLIENYLLKNRYLTLFSYSVVFVLVLTFFRRIEDVYIVLPKLVALGEEHTFRFWDVYRAFRQLIYILPVTGTATALYFIRSWYLKSRQNEKLSKEKLEAELNFLKSQIHPHFLFNTLNNIYSLSLNASTKVPELILKLSKMLSYMLYECNSIFIPIEKELELINSYFELEKLRHGDRVDIILDISGEKKDKFIPPLLLISFIENSFKHGINPETGHGWISLYILIENNSITFQLENSLNNNADNTVFNPDSIGLYNVKKRLELLYKNNYKLKITNDGSFLVYLELSLLPVKPSELM